MLRNAIIALMLLVAPLAQARTVMACAMMDGQIMERCCCEKAAEVMPCPRQEPPAMDDSCCVTMIDGERDQSVASAAERFKPSLERPSFDPGAALPAADAMLARQTVRSHARIRPPPTPLGSSASLYLLTARLRL